MYLFDPDVMSVRNLRIGDLVCYVSRSKPNDTVTHSLPVVGFSDKFVWASDGEINVVFDAWGVGKTGVYLDPDHYRRLRRALEARKALREELDNLPMSRLHTYRLVSSDDEE